MTSKPKVISILFAGLLFLGACGGGTGDSDINNQREEDGAGELSAEQMEKGIGPISSVELTAVDPELVETGESIFTVKCSACHKMDTRYVGPPLGDVLSRRSPEFVMNMILNPEGMLAEHPEAKAMLAEYLTPMANQNLTQDEARAILEYFRTTQPDTTAPAS